MRVSAMGRSIGPWLFGPILGLAAAYLFTSSLPPIECAPLDFSGNAGRRELFPGENQAPALMLMVAVGSFLAGVAARVPLNRLRGRQTGIEAGSTLLIAFGAAAVAVAAAGMSAMGYGDLLRAIGIAGLFGVAASLVFLVAAWIRGRTAAEVSRPLLVYLLAAGFAVIPAIALVAVPRGSLC